MFVALSAGVKGSGVWNRGIRLGLLGLAAAFFQVQPIQAQVLTNTTTRTNTPTRTATLFVTQTPTLANTATRTPTLFVTRTQTPTSTNTLTAFTPTPSWTPDSSCNYVGTLGGSMPFNSFITIGPGQMLAMDGTTGVGGATARKVNAFFTQAGAEVQAAAYSDSGSNYPANLLSISLLKTVSYGWNDFDIMDLVIGSNVKHWYVLSLPNTSPVSAVLPLNNGNYHVLAPGTLPAAYPVSYPVTWGQPQYQVEFCIVWTVTPTRTPSVTPTGTLAVVATNTPTISPTSFTTATPAITPTIFTTPTTTSTVLVTSTITPTPFISATPTNTPTPGVRFCNNTDTAVAGAIGCTVTVVNQCRALELDAMTSYFIMRLTVLCGCTPADIMNLRLTMGWDEICQYYAVDWTTFVQDLQTRCNVLLPEIDYPHMILRAAANNPDAFPIVQPVVPMPDNLTTGTQAQESCALCN